MKTVLSLTWNVVSNDFLVALFLVLPHFKRLRKKNKKRRLKICISVLYKMEGHEGLNLLALM